MSRSFASALVAFASTLFAFSGTLLTFIVELLIPSGHNHSSSRPLCLAAPRLALFPLFPLGFLLAACGGGGAGGGSKSAPIASLGTTSYAFNAQMTGTTSAAQGFNLTNLGTAPLQISSVALSGANASSFTVATGTNACGSSLAVNASCSIYVTFNPPSALSSSSAV